MEQFQKQPKDGYQKPYCKPKVTIKARHLYGCQSKARDERTNIKHNYKYPLLRSLLTQFKAVLLLQQIQRQRQQRTYLGQPFNKRLYQQGRSLHKCICFYNSCKVKSLKQWWKKSLRISSKPHPNTTIRIRIQ